MEIQYRLGIYYIRPAQLADPLTDGRLFLDKALILSRPAHTANGVTEELLCTTCIVGMYVAKVEQLLIVSGYPLPKANQDPQNKQHMIAMCVRLLCMNGM